MLDDVVHYCQSWFVRLPQGYKMNSVLAPFGWLNV